MELAFVWLHQHLHPSDAGPIAVYVSLLALLLFWSHLARKEP